MSVPVSDQSLRDLERKVLGGDREALESLKVSWLRERDAEVSLAALVSHYPAIYHGGPASTACPLINVSVEPVAVEGVKPEVGDYGLIFERPRQAGVPSSIRLYAFASLRTPLESFPVRRTPSRAEVIELQLQVLRSAGVSISPKMEADVRAVAARVDARQAPFDAPARDDL